jgi:hypothetical protein
MHGKFISLVRLLAAFYKSSSVAKFNEKYVPAICRSPRAVGVETELREYADKLVSIYSKNGVPDLKGYKKSINDALIIAQRLEEVIQAPSSNNDTVAQHIIFSKHLGIMMMTSCLLKLESQAEKKENSKVNK